MASFLSQQGYPPALAARVVAAVASVGFKDELRREGESGDGAGGARAPLEAEAACVQDADRLDAIGAIGIARAFTFGGARGRPLHDSDTAETGTALTRERYMAAGAPGAWVRSSPLFFHAAAEPAFTTAWLHAGIVYICKYRLIHYHQGATIAHFYDKLLLLKGLMKTTAGRRLAEARHCYTEAFVKQFLLEWAGEA